MAKSDYGPEVKSAMSEKPKAKQPPGFKGKRPPDKGETPADKAMDVKRGIPEGSAQDVAMDAGPPGGASVGMSPPPSTSVSQHNLSANPAHAAMAASIAHSILQHGR